MRMVMTKEEIILKKLFVALDDRSLDLEKVGQHLAGLPTSYALESLEEAMEHRAALCAHWQSPEGIEQDYEYLQSLSHEINGGDYAYAKTWRDVLSDALGELLTKLAILIPFGLFFWLIGAIWWW